MTLQEIQDAYGYVIGAAHYSHEIGEVIQVPNNGTEGAGATIVVIGTATKAEAEEQAIKAGLIHAHDANYYYRIRAE